MSMGDKIKHAGEEAVGKVKEVTGKVTGNEDLEATRRGRASQGQRQAGRGQRQGRRRRRFGQLISGTRAPSSIPGAVPWSGHRRRHLPFLSDQFGTSPVASLGPGPRHSPRNTVLTDIRRRAAGLSIARQQLSGSSVRAHRHLGGPGDWLPQCPSQCHPRTTVRCGRVRSTTNTCGAGSPKPG